MDWLLVLAAIVGAMCAIGYLTRKPGQTFSERMTELGGTFDRAGKGMTAAGCGLTLAVTVPILGFVLFSWAGLAVGLLIAVLFAGSAFSQGSDT